MYLQHSAPTILNTTKKKKKKGGARDGLKRWKAAVGSEKKTEKRKGDGRSVCCVLERQMKV